MHIAGIIAEYDPLHNGHAKHIAATKESGATHIIVVLGGNFTQRGEAALVPKADRVRMALAAGADLVVELPQPWAIASAEGFARGGVSLLHHMNCVNSISFGSECGDTQTLLRIAECMQTAVFSQHLQQFLGYGIPYATAVQNTIETLLGKEYAAVLDSPNNILGMAYCQMLLKLNSPIQPFTIKRLGVAHNETATGGQITSASHLRELVRAEDLSAAASFLPQTTMDILQNALGGGHCITDTKTTDRILLSYLRRLSKEQLAALPGISEGLENRLFAAIHTCTTIEDVLNTVKTKRYPMSRLRRILTCAFLDTNAAWESETPPYIRVLGMRDSGAELLHLIQKNADRPLFTDATQPPADTFSKEIFDFECKVSDLYGSLLSTALPCGQEFTTGMLKYRAET